jgi:hypothetical protein
LSIARILDEEPSLLDYLKNSGFVPGAVWTVSRVLLGAETLEITSDELHKKEVMAKSTAEKLLVEELYRDPINPWTSQFSKNY